MSSDPTELLFDAFFATREPEVADTDAALAAQHAIDLIEYAVVHESLDSRGVPRDVDGCTLSLLGRVNTALGLHRHDADADAPDLLVALVGMLESFDNADLSAADVMHKVGAARAAVAEATKEQQR